jgi:phage terminase small subunit|tara:strand:- start:172 stop:549 length:378 start_codon:yes stop_codon:yes gene_type:complete
MKSLTEKQQKFLNVLFEEANGKVVLAKQLAGYSDNTTTTEVVRGLKDEIAEATKEYLARVAPRAAFAMGNALDNPTELGIRDKMTAAKDLLDRTGHNKTDKMEVTSPSGLFILPPKNEEHDEKLS